MNDIQSKKVALLESYKRQDFDRLDLWLTEVRECALFLDDESERKNFERMMHKDAISMEIYRILGLLRNLNEDEWIETICKIANTYVIQNKAREFEFCINFAKYPLFDIVSKPKRVLLEIRDFFCEIKNSLFTLEKFREIRQKIQNSQDLRGMR